MYTFFLIIPLPFQNAKKIPSVFALGINLFWVRFYFFRLRLMVNEYIALTATADPPKPVKAITSKFKWRRRTKIRTDSYFLATINCFLFIFSYDLLLVFLLNLLIA